MITILDIFPSERILNSFNEEEFSFHFILLHFHRVQIVPIVLSTSKNGKAGRGVLECWSLYVNRNIPSWVSYPDVIGWILNPWGVDANRDISSRVEVEGEGLR